MTMKSAYMSLMAMVMMEGAMHGMSAPAERNNVANQLGYKDLIEEYKLIQQKKSRLSANRRRSIEFKVKHLVKKGDILPEEIA